MGNAGSKLLGFLLLPLYTKWLGVSGFGESDLIATYVSLLLGFMTLCVAEAIFVFTKGSDKSTITSFFTSSLILATLLLVVWLIIFFIIDYLFKTSYIDNVFIHNIWYIYFLVVSTFFQQYIQNFLISIGYVKLYSSTGIVLSISTFVSSYLLIPILGVKGYILSLGIANMITVLYSVIFSKSYVFLSISTFDNKKCIDILKYSVPLIPNSLVWWIVSTLNRPVMEHYLTFHEIGIYSLANRFPSIIVMLFSIFSMAWNISLFEEYKSESFNNFYKNVFIILFDILVIACIIISVFSDIFVNLLCTPDFKEASLYIPFLLLSTFLSCLSSYWGSVFGVVKKSKYYFITSSLGAVVALILNMILIPKFGIWGTVTSVLLSFVFIAFSRYYYSKKFIDTNLLIRSITYILLLFAVSLGVICISGMFYKLVFGLGIVIFLLSVESKFFFRTIINYIRDSREICLKI